MSSSKAADTAAERQRAELDGLYRKCSTAARRGDCAKVREMIEKIARSDRAYRARVAKDAAVAKCLAE